MTPVFLATKLTGFHLRTTIISLGMIYEDKTFYAEFTDYDQRQISRELFQGTIKKLSFHSEPNFVDVLGDNIEMKGDGCEVAREMVLWLPESFELWTDGLAYQWPLLHEILPELKTPFDICTAMRMKNLDPTVSREIFSGGYVEGEDVLYDAKLVEACYRRIECSQTK